MHVQSNAGDGGFRILPAEGKHDENAQVFEILWKDSGGIRLDDMKCTVYLGTNDALARFDSSDDYQGFKELYEKFGPA